MSELLKTPLSDWHKANGARMAEFAGYSMPINYPAGALKEIKAVREAAGLFDISHMRPIVVEGLSARSFLNYVDTRDLSRMKPGDALYGIACNDAGEPIDDLIVYQNPFSEKERESFLVISNASNGTQVHRHLCGVKKAFDMPDEHVKIEDGLDQYGFLSLQGPNAEKILAKAIHLEEAIPQKYYSCQYALIFGYFALVAKTGYTGEAGFEILCDKEVTQEIWAKLLEVGEPYGLIPCGLASRDTLRLEAGMPLFGHEMDADHDPIMAGLGKYVNFEKPRYFLGKWSLKNVLEGKSSKPREYLHAFIMEKGRVPRHGDKLFLKDEDNLKIGKLTSAGFSPTLEKNIAMGYTDRELSFDSEVLIEIGGKLYPATVTKLPFYKKAKK